MFSLIAESTQDSVWLNGFLRDADEEILDRVRVSDGGRRDVDVRRKMFKDTEEYEDFMDELLYDGINEVEFYKFYI